MNLPSSVRLAYERGRVRDAALQSLPVVFVAAAVFAATGGAAAQAGLMGLLLGVFLLARWRGLAWGRGAVLGVLAGTGPALVSACLMAQGLGCVGPGCAAWCTQICGAAGALGGALLGVGTREPRALMAGIFLASTAAALGCWPMGMGMLGGMLGALLLTTLGVAGARRALRKAYRFGRGSGGRTG